MDYVQQQELHQEFEGFNDNFFNKMDPIKRQRLQERLNKGAQKSVFESVKIILDKQKKAEEIRSEKQKKVLESAIRFSQNKKEKAQALVDVKSELTKQILEYKMLQAQENADYQNAVKASVASKAGCKLNTSINQLEEQKILADKVFEKQQKAEKIREENQNQIKENAMRFSQNKIEKAQELIDLKSELTKQVLETKMLQAQENAELQLAIKASLASKTGKKSNTQKSIEEEKQAQAQKVVEKLLNADEKRQANQNNIKMKAQKFSQNKKEMVEAMAEARSEYTKQVLEYKMLQAQENAEIQLAIKASIASKSGYKSNSSPNQEESKVQEEDFNDSKIKK